MTVQPMDEMRESVTTMRLGGTAVTGFPVGILALETRHPLIVGNVQNARSFSFPVIYEFVEVDDAWQLLNGDASLVEPIVEAALRLRRRGVRAIAGACGSFGYYQRAVRDALDVPVFLSPMLLVPLLLAALPSSMNLGVICGATSSLNERLFTACEIRSTERLTIVPMCGRPEFDRLIGGADTLDIERLRSEFLSTVDTLVERADPPIGSLLLQCSDLPPFASEAQERTNVPVFDTTQMIHWIASAADYPPYQSHVR